MRKEKKRRLEKKNRKKMKRERKRNKTDAIMKDKKIVTVRAIPKLIIKVFTIFIINFIFKSNISYHLLSFYFC